MSEPEPELCWSRGPRIGNSGVPYCKFFHPHEGLHRPHPNDGWPIDTAWGEPALREPWRGNDDLRNTD